MSYATLMVHLESARSNAGLLAIAGELAERFHSRVVGIATEKPVAYSGADGYVSGDLIERDIVEMHRRIDALEAEFRATFVTTNVAVEWRSYVSFGSLVEYLATEARCADLIVTGSPGRKANGSALVDTGALVMQAGRPVLVVPSAAKALKLDKVLVCWTDTREARRAVADGLHLLKQARAVDVVEVTADDLMPAARSRLQDVVGWLALHGVSAEPIATPINGDEKTTLASIIEERGAGLVIAGAYGHSRMREWVLGGVTRDLWMDAKHCSMLSH